MEPRGVPSAHVDVSRTVLADADGAPARFSDLAAEPLALILVRYFGCLPCQAFVQDVDAARDRFPASARVVAVDGSADYQARWLRDEQGVEMPLLRDLGRSTSGLRPSWGT